MGRVTSVKNVAAPADYPGQSANAAGVDLAHYVYVGRRLVRADLGNGITLAMSFDGRGHELERTATGTTGTLWRVQQLRDAAAYTRVENAMTRNGTRSRKSFLDSIYRLTHYQDDIVQWIDPVSWRHRMHQLIRFNNGQTVIDSATGHCHPAGPPAFEYDDLGNRLATTGTGTHTLRFSAERAERIYASGWCPWQYDANGNLRSDGIRSLAYDLNNALRGLQMTPRERR